MLIPVFDPLFNVDIDYNNADDYADNLDDTEDKLMLLLSLPSSFWFS